MATPAILGPVFKQRFFDANGKPLAGGKLYTYNAGSAGAVLAPTYKSNLVDVTTKNTNPIILDANGQADIWFVDAFPYMVRLTDANDVLQWTVDNVVCGVSAQIAAVYAAIAAFKAGTSVPTIAALTAIAAPVAGQVAFLSDKAREGFFVWRTEDLSAQIVNDPLKGIYVPSIGGCWVRQWDGVNACDSWWGAAPIATPGAPVVADSAVAAIQAGLNYLKTVGGVLVINGSRYWDTGVTLDFSTDTSPITPRVSIQGGGSRDTVLTLAAGSYTALTLTGSNTPGAADAQTFIKGLYFDKPDKQGAAVNVNKYSHFSMEDMRCNGSNIAITFTDVQESFLQNVEVTFANGGLYMAPGTFTSPNAITLENCKFGSNQQFGVDCRNAALINVKGGSIEGNGTTLATSTLPVWGIRCLWDDATHIEGSVSLNLDGVYIENNGNDATSAIPTADVWIVNSVAPSLVNIKNCSFQRHVSLFCTNNIRMETSGGFRHILNIGNGHRGFFGYVASGARPYVALSSVSDVYVNDNSYYDNNLERPDFSVVNNFTHDFSLQAAVRFDATSTAVGGQVAASAGVNVFTVTKNAVGVYTIVLARGLAGAFNYPDVSFLNLPGNYTITTEAANQYKISTFSDFACTTPADRPLIFKLFGKPVA